MIDIGLKLKNARKLNNLTQNQTAKILGVSKTTVASWENDCKFPSVENLIKLARLYHIPINYLVGVTKEKCVSLDGLTNKQQKILTSIVNELQIAELGKEKLTKSRKEILSDLMDEFFRSAQK